MSRELFARAALEQIPKILTLLDRNPHSPTYGCFDRNFWHYRIIDFPSGMAQELALPLALAYKLDIPNNPFYQQAVIKDWVEAAILYAARSAHRDGSCDDYFPNERAGGAAAFSLFACIESYSLLGLNNPVAIGFFMRRADWLAHHHESGRLSNHQALIALCLELLSRLLKTKEWDEAKEQRIERVLAWQSDEGWFQEYEGCDPGYHTLTLWCLTRLYELNPTAKLKDAIERAVRVASEFIHPDGSYGGEYGSRNTYNYFPHGFELAGRWMPEALTVNDRFLMGVRNGLAPCYSDDHIIGHHAWNYLLAWRDYVEQRPALAPRARGRVELKEAGLLIDRRGAAELYVALNKGGVFKLFRNEKLTASDTHLSLRVSARKIISSEPKVINKGDRVEIYVPARIAGKTRNAVAHLVDDYETEVDDNEIRVSGSLGWAKQSQMTTMKLIALRLVMLTVGRFFPNLIRWLLQRMLITGKSRAPFEFTRALKWGGEELIVTDELRAESWANVISAGIGCDQTSIYVVMSRTFQMGQLQGWLDLTDEIRKLAPGEALVLKRKL
ncbi:MAG TPA: hypothetical protein VNN73_13900 [Blastocatellia bacterium]|nr:hypothetical protein [Blastocatellia bacterium]